MDSKSIYVKCLCGHELSAFRILTAVGRLPVGRSPTETDVLPFLERLKCINCGRKGATRFIWKKSALPADRYVATDNSVDRIFHRTTCAFAVTIKGADEIRFKSVEDALRRGYRPCAGCRPCP